MLFGILLLQVSLEVSPACDSGVLFQSPTPTIELPWLRPGRYQDASLRLHQFLVRLQHPGAAVLGEPDLRVVMNLFVIELVLVIHNFHSAIVTKWLLLSLSVLKTTQNFIGYL